MHPVLSIMLLACTACLAHYRGYDSRNLIERDELRESEGYRGFYSQTSSKGTSCTNRKGNSVSINVVNSIMCMLVECPVCEPSPSGIPTHEVCDISKGNKMYKRCLRGTYINEVCGNRLDCYRGPKEQCTEKMDFDYYGQKCAHGFFCDSIFHECTGLGYTPDSRQRFFLSHMRSGIYGYVKKDELPENSLMML